MKKTDPRNHKPPERIAVLTFDFGVYGVEFCTRRGSVVQKVATWDGGRGVHGWVVAASYAAEWTQNAILPYDSVPVKTMRA